MVDDLNNRADKTLKKELLANGGIFNSMNPIAPYWYNFALTRDMFRRHHEKAVVADNTAMIGSANISDCYSGPVYGSYDFFDINIIMKNLGLNQVRGLFGAIADYYDLRLDNHISNEEILKMYNKDYGNSDFNIPNITSIKSHPPNLEEIQNFIVQNIHEAKKSIKIIQPYYYPITNVENALIDALKRGVQVELVTTAKRDQPAYASLKNVTLLGNLIKNGLKVYEIHDKLLHMKLYQYDDELYTAGMVFIFWIIKNRIIQ